VDAGLVRPDGGDGLAVSARLDRSRPARRAEPPRFIPEAPLQLARTIAAALNATAAYRAIVAATRKSPFIDLDLDLDLDFDLLVTTRFPIRPTNITPGNVSIGYGAR
jgi:hypothetical protein